MEVHVWELAIQIKKEIDVDAYMEIDGHLPVEEIGKEWEQQLVESYGGSKEVVIKSVVDVEEFEENVEDGKEITIEDVVFLKKLKNSIRSKECDNVVLQSQIREFTDSVEEEIVRKKTHRNNRRQTVAVLKNSFN